MKKNSIKIPADNLDMFARHGVKTIVAGNTEYKITKTRRRRCDHCGELKPKGDVTYTINPYEEDINGKTQWEKICNECYQNLLDDC